MNNLSPKRNLFEELTDKAQLKQKVYSNTLDTFGLLNLAMNSIVEDYRNFQKKNKETVPFELKPKGDFELELKFAGDVLIFLMHTNVFEFSRNHEVMKTSYVKEDKERSYCGVINIFNFLADSFKYNRLNDVGYLIGRVFVNKDMHYFIEGKREIGLLYNNFNTAVMNETSAREIVESAIRYTINFDLLTPPYENVKEITLYEMRSTLDSITLKTGKRLGFKFQADKD
ncbi:MAG: hypothetical protein K9G67_04855 [Bacteroidales bacterium]|nr:hypothetical protein [Bacteroidales bacterium]MCF8343455.1 hypothetical protein [Bacteroidales bacterium]MCF8375661.1 hypothetical protein [Bacteroidales bacterium]MCF8401459.1 hypothetical protein [Bacteroidales bacterium]